MGIGNIGLPGLIFILMMLLWVGALWKLLPKFGYPKWLSIFGVIPFAPLIFVWILAFSEPVRALSEAKT